MKYNYNENTKTLTVKMQKEIDHHEAKKIREEMDSYIEMYMPQKLTLDFKGVEFMDSSGIGVIMGRYKNIKRIEGTTTMTNVGESLRKVLEISGIISIIPIV